MGFVKSLAQGGMFGLAGLAASRNKSSSALAPPKQRAFGSMATTLGQQSGRKSLLTERQM
jgi:hypothetical protein